MADWDADDSFMGGGDTAGDWDNDGGDWDSPNVQDDWEADDWETEKPKADDKKKNPKKTLKQIAKEKEEEEKAAAAKKQAIDDEKKLLEQDPEYRLKKKEMEKAAVEQSEMSMINDLFGPSVASSKEEYRQEANPERARQLAALTGLGDGADGEAMVGSGRNDWDTAILHSEKSDKKAAPNPLDQIPFTTDQEVDAFVKLLARKVKDVGVAKSTNNSQTMSKVLLLELIRALGPDMKSTDVDEVLRVSTVIKNDLTKKTQNVKKNKNKKQLRLHDNGRDYSDEEFM